MDHQRLSCILPSNAPALSEDLLHDSTVPIRVLQERCSNRQNGLLDTNNPYPKAEPSSPSENAFLREIRGGRFAGMKEKPESEVIREANRLWHRLLRCKPYVKYRGRKPKDVPSTPEVKWPEHMEIAFCRALVKFPPIGRRKITDGVDNKPRGRNELIADFIQKYTGESRTRKQVSSHIQVLKPMVKDDDLIMSHLAGGEDASRHLRHRHQRSHHGRRPFSNAMMHHSRYVPQNMMSSHHTAIISGLPAPFNLLSSSTAKAPAAIHEPMHFEMFVRGNSDSTIPVHTFTSFRKPHTQLADFSISEPAQLYKYLPQLSSISSDELLHTQIILAESTLRLISGSLSKGAELGIQFEFKSACNLEIYDDFHCITRFFEDGNQVSDELQGKSTGRIDYDQRYKRLGNVQFNSKFWARKVMETARLLREASKLRRMAQTAESHEATIAENEARRLELETRTLLLRLTALQEIKARHRDTGKTVRLLLVCWKFEQTKHGAPGETTWRNIAHNIPTQHPKLESLVKEESLSQQHEAEDQDHFDPMAINLSHDDTSMALQQPFDPNHGFDLSDLSTMALNGMPSDVSVASAAGLPMPTSLYPSNEMDFTGGHIQMCLEPEVSIPAAIATAGIDGFTHDGASNHANVLYDQSQHWPEAVPSYTSHPYFDHGGAYGVRGFEREDVHAMGTGFGESGDQGMNHEFAGAGAHQHGGADEPLASIEFMGPEMGV